MSATIMPQQNHLLGALPAEVLDRLLPYFELIELPLGRACTEFCVNGHLAGHCHLVWRHNELKEPQRT